MTAAPINMPATNADPRLKCGTCRWFVSGVAGKTCQQVRQVVPDTKACVEYQVFKPSPFTYLNDDKFLKEMRKTLLVWTEQSIKKYADEIKTLRATKDYPIYKDPMVYIEEDKLAELGVRFEQIQAYSERLLDIRYELMDKQTELNILAKEVQSYLFTEYNQAVANLKNDSERGAFFKRAAPELHKALDQMDNLKEKADMAYQGLKDAHFALTRKLEAVLEIWKARAASQKVKSGITVG